jgi:putative spermidine/putrescine transport system ATP-binding protein
MSDRLAVMNKGAIEQIGSPRTIYEHPASRFVTDFIGESNILEGQVAGLSDGLVEIAFAGQRVVAPRSRELAVGDAVSFVVRPENVKLGDRANGQATNTVRGALRNESYQGSLVRYEIDVAGHSIIAEVQNTPDNPLYTAPQELTITWPVASTALLVD